jgi:hypothetical protein
MTNPNDGAPGLLSRVRWNFWVIFHHLLLAFTIASATVYFEQLPQFAPIDMITRTVMVAFQAMRVDDQSRETMQHGYRPAWNPEAAEGWPLVVIVPNLPAQAAEVRLDPATLAAGLVRKAADQQPAILAVNFDDLDPYYDEPRLNDPLCDYLVLAAFGQLRDPLPQGSDGDCHSRNEDVYELLDRVRTSLQSRSVFIDAVAAAAERTRVIVKTTRLPLDVAAFNRVVDSSDGFEKRLLARRLRWTLDLCSVPNVLVASSAAPLGGMLFERQTPSLGNLAWWTDPNPPRAFGLQLAVYSETDDACAAFRESAPLIQVAWNSTLGDSRDGLRAAVQRLGARHDSAGFGAVGTLSPHYFENRGNGIYIDVANLPPGERFDAMVPSGLRGRVVFIGDDANPTDVLQAKAMPEVAYDAAVYYSNVHGTIRPRHIAAFVGDVVLGGLLGLLFAWCWSNYRRARERMDAKHATSIGGAIVKVPWYLASRAVLIVNVAVMAGLTWLMLVIADWLLWHDVWINPLPLIVGMSIKGLLASRFPAEEPRDWWTFYNQHPDVPFQLVVIGLCIYGLLSAAH